MVGAGQWKSYNEAVAKITTAARDATEEQLSEWLAEHDATVAEAREQAQRILAANAEVYSQAASALAADWYDAQGRAAGMRLDRAVTSVAVDTESLAKTVRYQASKLVDGDVDGFCAAVGEWAENEAKRALNRTIMANARRDRRKGVRFARVTSGRNTCAFCLMLASRGAVYHSRKTAGELGQYHRHCSCKIVPSYSGNQYEVLVEGHDPKDALRLWQEIAGLDESVVNRLKASFGSESDRIPDGKGADSGALATFDTVTLPCGRKFLFKSGMDKAKQNLGVAQLLSAYDELPPALQDRMQMKIYVVDSPNPMDSYWRKRYKRFSRSYATGGEEITFWAHVGHDGEYLKGTLCHETGHLIDMRGSTGETRFSSDADWQEAMTLDYRTTGESHPSDYAANSYAEDFAESVKGYTLEQESFRGVFPNRAKLLDRIFGEGNGSS